MKVKSQKSVTLVDSLRPCGLSPTGLLCPWDSPGKSTGAGCHFLLQGIFPTQGLNPGLPHFGQTLRADPLGKSPSFQYLYSSGCSFTTLESLPLSTLPCQRDVTTCLFGSSIWSLDLFAWFYVWPYYLNYYSFTTRWFDSLHAFSLFSFLTIYLAATTFFLGEL